ncbi:nudix (nucleoside diphosphate linked moiety X)-type motif 6, isoform CRA_d [Mus musculus]|nr:nudix (nucleoside diphosphate linked moiety X)-type motif 6, isoform CRA_d [Mus musculus]
MWWMWRTRYWFSTLLYAGGARLRPGRRTASGGIWGRLGALVAAPYVARAGCRRLPEALAGCHSAVALGRTDSCLATYPHPSEPLHCPCCFPGLLLPPRKTPFLNTDSVARRRTQQTPGICYTPSWSCSRHSSPRGF